MSEDLLSPCQNALDAIEADPLDLPENILAHLRTCTACSEARVHWLAQQEAPAALAPAGYFTTLPQRVLRKLPFSRRPGPRHHVVLWLAAAGLALALGVGGYLAGRVQQAPLVEASLTADPAELLPEAPFDTGDDVLSQLSELSPEEAEAVLQRLDSRP